MNCDFKGCESTAQYYGWQQCYFVCPEHTAWGEEIEARIIAAHDESQENL